MSERAVYCMNLKDNREGSALASSKIKFDFCLSEQVVGIGWASDKISLSEPAFADAKKYLSALKPGDLVWIKKPGEDLYFIAEILDEKPFSSGDDRYDKHDLGYCRKCRFYRVGSKEDIPAEYIDYLKRLVTPQTIQSRTDTELIDAVNSIWMNCDEQEETQSAGNETETLSSAKKRGKKIPKKYKVLLIALSSIIVGLVAFFVVHGVVFDIRSGEAEREMNAKLEDKIFVHRADDVMVVLDIKANGIYDKKNYRIGEDENTLEFQEAEITGDQLKYYYSYWGDLIRITAYGYGFNSNEIAIQFGTEYTLATEEELAMINKADERELTKRKLSDIMMTADEYKEAYKASGMPVSEDLIDVDILYSDKLDDTTFLVVVDAEEFKVLTKSAKGTYYGYDYMMGPMMLFLESVPGALKTTTEIIQRWDAAEEADSFMPDVKKAEFTYNGITYTRVTENGTRFMSIEISVDKSYEIYLADYPEFMTGENNQTDDNNNSSSYGQENGNSNVDGNVGSNSSGNGSTNTGDNENSNTGGNGNTNTGDNENTNTGNNAEVDPCANGHSWIEITNTVHHDEIGHYETVQDAREVIKYQCSVCYSRFDSIEQYYSHFDETHSYDDLLVDIYRDRYETVTDWEYYEKQEWVVDQEAYDEIVVTGYQCSVCDTMK